MSLSSIHGSNKKKRPSEFSTKIDMPDSNQLQGASTNPNSTKQKQSLTVFHHQ